MEESDGSTNAARLGVAYGLTAYALWGIFPLYFHLLFVRGVWPLEVLAHRVAWSCLLLLAVVTVQGRWSQIAAAMRNRRIVVTLSISTLLIATNWLTFLYAVSTGQVLQASLGYFLTPLANVLIGVTLLGEQLRTWQRISVALATFGVILMAYLGGQFPWIALVLAVTFGFYGFCRKTVAVDSMLGLTIETVLLAPLAVFFIGNLYAGGNGTASTSLVWGLLIFSGVATALPLLLFASAARRLRFVTIGFLQYVGPTIQFLLAVFILHEAFPLEKVVSFSFIWAAVGVYSLDSLLSAYRPVNYSKKSGK